MGNVVNRVFDSSGPEGKVRGTPQQIIDKYNQLARDAQLSNDRVAAENFQQHAEHYLRMLAEAQREQQERQAQQNQQQQDRQQRNNGQAGQPQGEQPQPATPDVPTEQPETVDAASEQPQPVVNDVIEADAAVAESPLVETPENQAPKTRRPRRKPKPVADEAPETPAAPDAAE